VHLFSFITHFLSTPLLLLCKDRSLHALRTVRTVPYKQLVQDL
jgi:hypothetical protein